MARDIPNKPMPSVTVIGIGGKKPPPKAGAGSDVVPGENAGDNDDTGGESTFMCPACGCKLGVEQKDESASETGMGATG